MYLYSKLVKYLAFLYVFVQQLVKYLAFLYVFVQQTGQIPRLSLCICTANWSNTSPFLPKHRDVVSLPPQKNVQHPVADPPQSPADRV